MSFYRKNVYLRNFNDRNMCTIIGRKKEIAELKRLRDSKRPEFIAVYGRRRVGKTFLINEVFRDEMVFHHTGLSPFDNKRKVTMKRQLENFTFSLIRHGMDDIEPPKNWLEAFFLLEKFLKSRNNGSRQVVFIDEAPWMDTARSGFLTALEAFWNGWGNTQHQLCLIVCGSATSWMMDNLINNKGGLYNRLTAEIKLTPFCLGECEDFFKSRSIKLSRYNIMQAYMILGGIPYYLNLFNPSLSLAQNIDAFFFDRNAKLSNEFERLFNSIFSNAELCMKIVRLLGQRHLGYTRAELATQLSLSPNGAFSETLNALVSSDFLKEYKTSHEGRKKSKYKLSDPFCWFWLHFMDRKRITENDYWQHHLKDAETSAWRGIAFEELCFRHIKQIKQALQIAGVSSVEYPLIDKGDAEHPGMQLDLIIDRRDDVLNVCEMKYTASAFVLTKPYAETIEQRRAALEQRYPHKSIHMTLVTTYPTSADTYADTFQSEVTADDLFAQLR